MDKIKPAGKRFGEEFFLVVGTPGFHAVWAALAQYVENTAEGIDLYGGSEREAEELAAARILLARLDECAAQAAEG